MKKALLVATVQSHICQFHKPLVKMLHENGFEVHVAARNNLDVKDGMKLDFADKVFDIPFERSPFHPKNLTAYKALKKVVNNDTYCVIHTNTPVGGILGRLSARKQRKKGCKVLYTAHGFHFYEGASKKNWLIYYPIEAFMCRYTDGLITICDEDYNLSSNKFKVNTFRIHGVGASTTRFATPENDEIEALRHKFGYPLNNKIIICTGELNNNKNQIIAIKAMKKVIERFPDTLLLLAGNGPNEEILKNAIADLNLSDNVKLIGYRKDLENFVKLSDIAISCSIREGLGLNLIEAMLCRKPAVATINRGHKELIREGRNGFLVETTDSDTLAEKIQLLLENKAMLKSFGEQGYEYAQKYTDKSVQLELFDIYSKTNIIN
ncbi:MAG: glycosyltransferase family 4 protein [Ruminococcus sp.]|nr:glycosyltransferase family 4 protein [Ruminococcus sp.]